MRSKDSHSGSFLTSSQREATCPQQGHLQVMQCPLAGSTLSQLNFSPHGMSRKRFRVIQQGDCSRAWQCLLGSLVIREPKLVLGRDQRTIGPCQTDITMRACTRNAKSRPRLLTWLGMRWQVWANNQHMEAHGLSWCKRCPLTRTKAKPSSLGLSPTVRNSRPRHQQQVEIQHS